MLTSLFAAGGRRADRNWPLDGLPQSTYAPSRATSQRPRSCAAWCLICTVTVLLAAATMGVNILHPGAGLGQQLALSGKNRALAEVDADGDLAAAQHEVDYRDEPTLLQRETDGAAISADAAAADSADGSPDSPGAGEDADVEPPVEEEPSGRERAATGLAETRAAAKDADDEDDVQALEEAASGGMAEDEGEQSPAVEDETERPQPSAAEADVPDAAQDASSAEAVDGGAAEPDTEVTEISDSAEGVANGEPADGDQRPKEDQDELLTPLSDLAADAEPQTEPEQPEAAADGASDADAGAAAVEPAAGSAAVAKDDVGGTAEAAAEDAAADGDKAPDARVPEDEETAMLVEPKRAVPAWRRAHDSSAANTGDEASARPDGINAIKWPVDGSAAEGTEFVIDIRRVEEKEPSQIQESVLITRSAISPEIEGSTMGQSTLADDQSVNEQAQERGVNEPAGEQGPIEEAVSTEEEVVDRGGIDAAEAAAAANSDESADSERDVGDAIVSAGDAGNANNEMGTF